MAGYDLMTAGKSPAEIRRMKRRRRMLGAGMGGKADLYADMSKQDADMSKKDAEITKAEARMLGITGGRKPAPIEDRSVPIPKTVTETKTSPKKAKFGVGPSKTIMHNGISMANVTADQLKKTGLKSTKAYMRRWKELGKRPTTATAKAIPTVDATRAARIKRGQSESRLDSNVRRIKEKLAKEGAVKQEVSPSTTVRSPQRLLHGDAAVRALNQREADRRDNARLAEEDEGTSTFMPGLLPSIRPMFKKGGLVKKSAAKKPAAKKSAAKKPSRKKSIDGIARRGKTRAKHR